MSLNFNFEGWLRNIIKLGKYKAVKFANFEYFFIIQYYFIIQYLFIETTMRDNRSKISNSQSAIVYRTDEISP